MEKRRLIITIIAAIIIFAIGIIAGILFQSQKIPTVSNILGNSATSADLANQVRSKAISSVMIFGEVKEISGKTLRVSNNGDTVSVLISDSAKLSIINTAEKNNTTKNAAFANIKIGDSVNIGARVSENNLFVGSSVMIFSK